MKIITGETKLSELQKFFRIPLTDFQKEQNKERLARSIQQSLRVEGYKVSLSAIRVSMKRILK